VARAAALMLVFLPSMGVALPSAVTFMAHGVCVCKGGGGGGAGGLHTFAFGMFVIGCSKNESARQTPCQLLLRLSRHAGGTIGCSPELCRPSQLRRASSPAACHPPTPRSDGEGWAGGRRPRGAGRGGG
jgi:hypothetical protein